MFDAKGPGFQLPQNAEKDFIDEALLRAITPELVIARLTALPDWQAATP